MITIGIDPGLTGAIGVLRDGCYVSVEDMPTVFKGTGSVKREVDAAGLIRILRDLCPSEEFISVALEKVSSMPGQGVSSVFSLGDSYGCTRSSVAALGLELNLVTPQIWKKSYNLSSDKEASRALASRLFPTAPLHLKKYEGRAEALLISKYLYDTKFK